MNDFHIWVACRNSCSCIAWFINYRVFWCCESIYVLRSVACHGPIDLHHCLVRYSSVNIIFKEKTWVGGGTMARKRGKRECLHCSAILNHALMASAARLFLLLYERTDVLNGEGDISIVGLVTLDNYSCFVPEQVLKGSISILIWTLRSL